MNKIHFICLILILHNNVLAQVKSNFILPIHVIAKHNFFLQYSPRLETGSHVNEAGVDFQFSKVIPKKLLTINFSYRTGISYYLTNIGIDGQSFVGEQEVMLTTSLGEKAMSSYCLSPVLRKHNISYYLIYYIATDHTTQLSGGIKYKYATFKSEWNFYFENDFFAFTSLDEFRTFAFELNHKKSINNHVYGIGIYNALWTGTTKGLGLLNRQQTYDMSKQYGGKYSNGILALKFYFDNFSVGIGYDSEKIRTVIQNNFHYIINDGKIPPLNRGDRAFLQLSILDFSSLY